jgi:ribosomal protein L7/L12
MNEIKESARKLYNTLVAFGVDLPQKKIHAIKFIRTETQCGLKEAKDAWEWQVEESERQRQRDREELITLERQREELTRKIDIIRQRVGW